jgi:hypothetical protein
VALSDTLSALTDYSWSDIMKAAKHAMVTAALGGQNLSIGGRAIGRISIEDAKKLYELAQQMVNDETTESSGGTALVQFGERV